MSTASSPVAGQRPTASAGSPADAASFAAGARALASSSAAASLIGSLGSTPPGKLAFFNDLVPLADPAAFKAHLAPLRRAEWVVHARPPFGGPAAVPGLPRPLHPPRRHLGQPPDRSGSAGRHLPLEGLSRRRPRHRRRQDQGHDTRARMQVSASASCCTSCPRASIARPALPAALPGSRRARPPRAHPSGSTAGPASAATSKRLDARSTRLRRQRWIAKPACPCCGGPMRITASASLAARRPAAASGSAAHDRRTCTPPPPSHPPLSPHAGFEVTCASRRRLQLRRVFRDQRPGLAWPSQGRSGCGQAKPAHLRRYLRRPPAQRLIPIGSTGLTAASSPEGSPDADPPRLPTPRAGPASETLNRIGPGLTARSRSPAARPTPSFTAEFDPWQSAPPSAPGSASPWRSAPDAGAGRDGRSCRTERSAKGDASGAGSAAAGAGRRRAKG